MLGKMLPALLLPLLTGCSTLLGPPVIPGVTTQAEIVARKGPPALHVEEAKQVTRLFWPTGPNGTSTIRARFDGQQRLISYEEVLDMQHFSKIQPGMSMDDVLREIGPPFAPWTIYFKARDELVWEWRYCDSWNAAARFNVLFDGTSKLVRSTMSLTEAQRFYGRLSPPCGQTYLNVSPAPGLSK
ncbi:MAG: hypothetical protein KGL40_00535 [Rhodocyclaceae bacterium]|nr:hypothetical protein [Rhodocyclaceae bacterium]